MLSDYQHSQCNPPPHLRRWWVSTRTYVADCPDGKVGSQVSETAQARSYFSQEHADQKAMLAAKAAAIAKLVCLFTSTKTVTAYCPNNRAISKTATAIRHSSVSQADADFKAFAAAKQLAWLDLACYQNTEQSYTAHCPNGFTGTPIIRTVDAGTFFSKTSQADADNKAQTQARFDALSDLDCTPVQTPPTTFYNSTQSYTANCPAGTTGDPVTKFVEPNAFSSIVSKADADAQALASARSQAQAQLHCTPVPPPSWVNEEQTATASCPDGTNGDDQSATIPAGTFTSDVSQEDANFQAHDIAHETADRELTCYKNCPGESFTLHATLEFGGVDTDWSGIVGAGGTRGACGETGEISGDEVDGLTTMTVNLIFDYSLSQWRIQWGFGDVSDSIMPDDGSVNPRGSYSDATGLAPENHNRIIGIYIT